MTEQKQLTPKSGESPTKTYWISLSNLFLWITLGTVFLLIWVFFRFQNEEVKYNTTKRAVDFEITRVNSFAPNYLQAMLGNYSYTEKILKDISLFEDNLTVLSEGSLGIIKPSDEQATIIQMITDDWKAARSYLGEVLSSQETQITARQNVTETVRVDSQLSSTLGLLAKTLGKGQSKLSVSISHLQEKTRELLALMQHIFIAGNRVENVTKSLNDGLNAYFTAVESYEKRIKTFAQRSPSNEQRRLMKAISTDMSTLKTHFAELTSYMPQYLQASRLTADIERLTVKLVTELHRLKSSYNASNFLPFTWLPIRYSQLMLILMVTAVISLMLWAVLQMIKENNLRAEASQMKKAADIRNHKEQKAIVSLMDELRGLSQGDLTIEARAAGSNLGAIADSVNFAIESMRDLVGVIKKTSVAVSNSTTQVKQTSYQLLNSSDLTSKQIEQTNDVMADVMQMLDDVGMSSDASIDVALASAGIAKAGRQQVVSAIQNMGQIRENIQDTSKRLKRLGESTQEIGGIVEVVQSIADQTNMLSLNAAIQASAAGEAGRGFAVVAEEVQRLAEQTGYAVTQIERLVLTMQSEAKEAMQSMDVSTQQVIKGAKISETAGEHLDRIEDVSGNLANLTVKMSEAVKSASSLAVKVNTNMHNLETLNTKTTDEVHSVSEQIDNLEDLSIALRRSISGFKLPLPKKKTDLSDE